MSTPVVLLIENFAASVPAIENEIESLSESVAVTVLTVVPFSAAENEAELVKLGERSLTFVTVTVKARDADAVPSLTLTVNR